jgi:hypothetical protein
MKYSVFFALMIFFFGANAQPLKDSLLAKDGAELVQEMRMMWNCDQATRKYVHYQTFDSHLIDSIEKLDGDVQKHIVDSMGLSPSNMELAWKNYITPIDSIHTIRMIGILKQYGFPSTSRIKRITGISMGFHPYMLLVHSPKRYREELKVLISTERSVGNLSRCEYGYLMWHLNGRNDFRYFLENGYVMQKQADGSEKLVAKDCD